jgi:uncharacterized protein (UPF0333 family)
MKIQKRDHIFSGVCIVLAALVMVAFYPAMASAHGPKEVKLGYDAAAKALQVTITHTNFKADHYISKVEVTKNGKALMSQEYTSQPAETFSYSYKVDAVVGDVLEVKASCSKFGSKTEKLKVSPAPVSK